MNLPTTRSNPPAATSRTGTGVAALPNDPGLNAILADPRLGATAKLIVIALVKNWAWVKDCCWPCDKTIGAAIGKSPGHVQRSLRQLEQTGHIAREKTDDVPNGRRIWLLWRQSGGRAGARGETAPAREVPAAPARGEQVVVVNGGKEPGIRFVPPRQRPEGAPTSTAISDPMATLPSGPPAEESANQSVPSPVAREPVRTPSELEGPALSTVRPLPEPAGGILPGPTPLPAPAAPEDATMALDLESIGRPALSPPTPVAARISRIGAPTFRAPSSPPTPGGAAMRKRPGPGPTLDELAKVAGETADPILAAEVARRTAPPAPPEPSPRSLPTAELLAKLPGRHDLIAAATRRLAEETDDFKPASWSFFGKAVEAVAARSVPPEVLLGCHHQATGPKAKDPGKVFVTAWKREAHLRC